MISAIPQTGVRASWLSALGRFVAGVAQPTVTEAVVRIDPTGAYQTVQGWGTSLAWWGAVVGGWSEPARNAIADLVFDPAAGLGLNVVRYNIGGGDDPTHHHMRPGGAVPGYRPAPETWDPAADANQRWMLRAAQVRGADVFEAFANSPPYWMTHSGCAAGSADGAGNNLRDDAVDAFAGYLAEVVAYFRDAWGLTFGSIEPFNEPAATNWRAGNNQEGCHFSRDQQRAVIARLAAHLAARGLGDTAIAAADDYSIDQAVDTVASYDAATLALIAHINTHSYSGSRRAHVRELAARYGKALWQSEYGNGGGPHDHAAMGPGLQLAGQIRRDMTDLRPAAWVYWQAVENEGGNNWGFIHATFTGLGEDYWLTKQYYVMAQHSRFIRPGWRVLAADDMNTLAAYDAASGTLALVYTNAAAGAANVAFDLSRFGALPRAAALYRTSPTEDLARLPDVPLVDGTLQLAVPAQSVTTGILTGITAWS